MKLYLKTRNVFISLSISIIVIAIVLIHFYKNEMIGNLLFGVAASTIIIAIQSHMASRVEESKLLVSKLRKIYELSMHFENFNHFSIDFFAHSFIDEYYQNKERIELIIAEKNEIANISYLNKKTKTDLNVIIKQVTDLEVNLHFIFTKFENQSNKMKVIYFMEFYDILKSFDFKDLRKKVSQLGFDLDFREFYKIDYSNQLKTQIESLELKNSIQVYDKELEEKHKTEYKALKKEFDTCFKFQEYLNERKRLNR